MTDPVLRLEAVRLSVEPGGQVQTTITVQNLGDIVEGYRLDVLGEGASDWAQVLPDEVQVYPGQDSTAVLVFTPPSDAVAGSGAFPFAVRARSVVDEETSAVVEGDLDLGRVFGLQAKLSPVTSTGRWRGKHFVQFTNWGNAPVKLKLTATDPDEKLGFAVHPELVEVPIGAEAGAAVLVRTRKPFLRGQPVRLPFTVTAEPDPPEPVARGPAGPLPIMADPRRAAVDGALNQRPILSRFVVVVAVLALAAIGFGLFLALRPGPPVETAALRTGAPKTPTLTAAAKDATTVVLSWDGEAGLDGYNLYQVAANGKNADIIVVPGTLEQTEVKDLQPGTQYCFQLQAVRGKIPSGTSPSACASTEFVAVTTTAGDATVTSTVPPSSGTDGAGATSGSAGAPTESTGGLTPSPSQGSSSAPTDGGGQTAGGGPTGGQSAGGQTAGSGDHAGWRRDGTAGNTGAVTTPTGPGNSGGTAGQTTGPGTVVATPTGAAGTAVAARLPAGTYLVVLLPVPKEPAWGRAAGRWCSRAGTARGYPGADRTHLGIPGSDLLPEQRRHHRVVPGATSGRCSPWPKPRPWRPRTRSGGSPGRCRRADRQGWSTRRLPTRAHGHVTAVGGACLARPGHHPDLGDGVDVHRRVGIRRVDVGHRDADLLRGDRLGQLERLDRADVLHRQLPTGGAVGEGQLECLGPVLIRPLRVVRADRPPSAGTGPWSACGRFNTSEPNDPGGGTTPGEMQAPASPGGCQVEAHAVASRSSAASGG